LYLPTFIKTLGNQFTNGVKAQYPLFYSKHNTIFIIQYSNNLLYHTLPLGLLLFGCVSCFDVH